MEVDNKRGNRSKINAVEDWLGEPFEFPDIVDSKDYYAKYLGEPVQKRVCRHIECPYKYCCFHQRFDETYERIRSIICTPKTVGEMDTCLMYLDV